MRGFQKFAQICHTLNPPTLPEQAPAISLTQRRDQLLILRYVHYMSQNRPYHEILIMLRDEHFISPERINDIISNNLNQIKHLRQAPPKKNDLKETYPHLIW